MVGAYERRLSQLQDRVRAAKLDGALVTDPDAIFYLSGYWGYASFVSCGRPNFLWVPLSGAPTIITPQMESEMCRHLSAFDDIRGWIDGIDDEWRRPLTQALGKSTARLAIDRSKSPVVVLDYMCEAHSSIEIADLGAILDDMRMIKDDDELRTMRQAGEVAVAMAAAGEAAIAIGVPEYEVSLAAMSAGSRKAAEIIRSIGDDQFSSPMVHNLQIMQSGRHTCMVHRRPTVREIEHGDPVYLCFCGINVFKGYWLGFDREFFCEAVTDEQARTYETCIAAQMAALDAIRPGVAAEDVHFAADDVYRDAGLGATYRTGRGTGASILENPQLKAGNKMPLRAGMTFAIDGGITIEGHFGARVGDSIVVTDSGFEYLTPYPKELKVLRRGT